MKTTKQTVTQTGGDFEALHGAVSALREQMTFLTALTPAERGKLGYAAAHLEEIKASLAVAKANPSLLPIAFDLPRFEVDASHVVNLHQVSTQLKSLAADVQDTLAVASARALKSSRQLRKVVKAMAASTPGLKLVTESLDAVTPRSAPRGPTAVAAPPGTAPAPAPAAGSPVSPQTQVA